MPTPGAVALQIAIGNVAIPLAAFPAATIDNSSETITQLAAGMHAGWIALYPTTSSICETEIENAFGARLAVGWNSRCWLRALGKGIDNEMSAWAASYAAGVHSYAPSATSIYNSMLAEIALCGLNNANADPLPLAAANAWMSYFAQEGG